MHPGEAQAQEGEEVRATRTSRRRKKRRAKKRKPRCKKKPKLRPPGRPIPPPPAPRPDRHPCRSGPCRSRRRPRRRRARCTRSARRSASTRARSAAARPSACCGAPASARAPATSSGSPRWTSRPPCSRSPGPSGAAPMSGADADRRRRAAVAAGHLVRRPPLLVRPHGPLGPPARRAPRARLPRLVGDLQRRRRLQRDDARADERLPRARARLVPRDDARGHHRPGDARVPQRDRQPAQRRQRELRARADGAVHARRRPRRLHRDRRARAGALADRLARRLVRAPRACTTSASTRRAGTPAPRPCSGGPGRCEVGGRLPAGRSTTRCTPSFFVAKLWSYFIPEPPSADVAGRLERLYVDSGNQIRPVLEAILCSPELYEGPRMTKPPVVLNAGMLRALGQVDHRRGVGVAGRRRRPAPLPPARRLGLGRRALAGLQHDPRALGHRQLRRRAAARVRPDSAEATPIPPRRRRRRSPPRARSGSTRTSSRRPTAWLLAFAREFQPPADDRVDARVAARAARASGAPSARPPCVISSPSLPITRPADARSHHLLLRLHRLLALRAAAHRRRGHRRPRPARDRAGHAAARPAPASRGARSSPARPGSRSPCSAAPR